MHEGCENLSAFPVKFVTHCLGCWFRFSAMFCVCFSFAFFVYLLIRLMVRFCKFSCKLGWQYQCNWFSGKTRLQNVPLCVECDIK